MYRITSSFLFLILLMTCFSPLDSLSQNTLIIEIVGLKNNTGQVLLELSNEKGEKISGHIQSIENKRSVIVIKNLKSGKYSFKYFHDENKNQKLDTNFIGMPKEGFGFANNAKGSFGPPDFEKTIINLKGDSNLKCTAIYL